MDRRRFLTSAALSAASYRQVLGANEQVRVGLIGCGGRGRYVGKFMAEAPNTRFVATADVYLPNADAARGWAGGDAKAFQDFRKLLEMKDVDAVLIATPDHWHAIPTVLACQAGKDVYVEKPLAHNIHEGRVMVDAARRHNRIAVIGTQQRSATHFPEVARIIQSGPLGGLRFVRIWNYVNMAPNGVPAEPDSTPPEGLDWDFYLGPAPRVPYNRKRHLGTYRWFSDYSGGYITDYGTHRFDTMHQIMGVDAPLSVAATGGRFSVKDAGDVPDVMQVTYDYPGFILSYEAIRMSGHGVGGRSPGMRYYNAKGELDRPHGHAYYGTNGALFCDRIGYEIYPDNDKIIRKTHNTTDATSLHARHFIDCVRSRERSKADVETGHRSTIVAHLGNIAYRTGKKLKWDRAKEDFANAPEATALLRRKARAPWTLI